MNQRRLFIAALVGTLTVPIVGSAWGQSLEQRIEQVRRQHNATNPTGSAAVARDYAPATPAQRLRDRVDVVLIEEAPARRAFEWWSATTNIPLVLDWNAMEDEGIDPERPMNLRLTNIPAGQLLGIMMRQIGGGRDIELIYEVTPWYVQVMTKRQANRNLVTRIYLVEDLILEVPNFEGPAFDLGSALEGGTSARDSRRSGGTGGGGGGGGGGIFAQDTSIDSEPRTTRRERGEALAQLVMDTIEPELWLEGDGASIRFFNGRLIVSAPLYVHRQIGLAPAPDTRGVLGASPYAMPTGRGIGDLDPIGRINQPTPIASVRRH